MTTYTCDPNLEISGRTAHALLESINRDNYLHILERHALADIDKNSWYRLQDLLNVLNDMNCISPDLMGQKASKNKRDSLKFQKRA